MPESIAAVPAGPPPPGGGGAPSGKRLFVITEVRAEWVENTFIVEFDPDDPDTEQGLDEEGLKLVALEIHAEGGSEFIGESCLGGLETLDPRSCEAEPIETATHGHPDIAERIAAAITANAVAREAVALVREDAADA